MLSMAQNQKFFKEWRKFRKLTQQQVADALGSSSGYVSDLENGKRRYNEDHLDALAELFQCSTADLISTNPLEGTGGAEVVDIWERIPDRWRDRAKQALEAFREDDEKDSA